MQAADFELRVPLMSKARPRFNRRTGAVYSPEAYEDWKATVRAILAEWWTVEPLDGVHCLLLSFRGPARGDLDNLAGAVLDAGNELIWRDDTVAVIPTLALRFTKVPPKQSSIYIKVIWE